MRVLKEQNRNIASMFASMNRATSASSSADPAEATSPSAGHAQHEHAADGKDDGDSSIPPNKKLKMPLTISENLKKWQN